MGRMMRRRSCRVSWTCLLLSEGWKSDLYGVRSVEGHLLQTIGWCIGHPTAEAWLRLYCQGTKESTQVQHVARFIMECTLFTRDFVGLKSSSVAKGSLLMARHVCGLASRADLGPGEKEVKHVTTCLDTLFAEHSKSVSTICIEKVSSASALHHRSLR